MNKSYERFVKKSDDLKVESTVTDDTNIKSEKKVKRALGVVTNCLRLCLREEPTTNSNALKYFEALSEVEIDLSKSTDAFYKVIADDGTEGYCMKNYLTIKG